MSHAPAETAPLLPSLQLWLDITKPALTSVRPLRRGIRDWVAARAIATGRVDITLAAEGFAQPALTAGKLCREYAC